MNIASLAESLQALSSIEPEAGRIASFVRERGRIISIVPMNMEEVVIPSREEFPEWREEALPHFEPWGITLTDDYDEFLRRCTESGFLIQRLKTELPDDWQPYHELAIAPLGEDLREYRIPRGRMAHTYMEAEQGRLRSVNLAISDQPVSGLFLALSSLPHLVCAREFLDGGHERIITDEKFRDALLARTNSRSGAHILDEQSLCLKYESHKMVLSIIRSVVGKTVFDAIVDMYGLSMMGGDFEGCAHFIAQQLEGVAGAPRSSFEEGLRPHIIREVLHVRVTPFSQFREYRLTHEPDAEFKPAISAS